MLKIKEFRKKKGLTQVELSNLIGLANNAVTNYENGYRTPDIYTLVKIAVVLDVTLDELVDFKTQYELLHKELEDKVLKKEKEPKS